MRNRQRTGRGLRTPLNDPEQEAPICTDADALIPPALTAAFAEYRAGSIRGESVERRTERARTCAAVLSDAERAMFAQLIVTDGVVLEDLLPEDERAYYLALGEFALAVTQHREPDMNRRLDAHVRRVPGNRRAEFRRDAHGVGILMDILGHA